MYSLKELETINTLKPIVFEYIKEGKRIGYTQEILLSVMQDSIVVLTGYPSIHLLEHVLRLHGPRTPWVPDEPFVPKDYVYIIDPELDLRHLHKMPMYESNFNVRTELYHPVDNFNAEKLVPETNIKIQIIHTKLYTDTWDKICGVMSVDMPDLIPYYETRLRRFSYTNRL